jgi:putative PEP-CTERM system TPR-repeat lipoprotein
MDPKHLSTAKRLGAVLVAASLLSGCEYMMSSEARIERAEASMAKGDMSAAIVDLKNVLEKDAEDQKARLLLAKAQLSLGDVSAAVIDFNRVDPKKVKPEDYEPVLWQVRLAERKFGEMVPALSKARPGLSESQRLLLLARAHAGLGQSTQAQTALEQAVKQDPANDEALTGLAAVLAATGDTDRALKLLNDGVKARPNSGLLHRALGQIYTGMGRLPDAENAFRKALEQSSPKGDLPGYLFAAGGLADSLLAQGKLDEAKAVSDRLTKDAPNAGLTLLTRGRVAAAQRNYAAALEDLTKILNADPENVQVRTLVGGVNLEQGNLEQATMNLRRALAASPDFVPARRLLAQALMAQGRADEAQKTLQQAAAAGKPASPDLLLMQARAALAAGDQPRALELLKQLEEQGVPTESARLDLAAAYIQVGQPDRAMALLGTEGGTDARREQLRLIATTTKDRAAGVRALQEYAEKNAKDGGAVRFAALTLGALGEFGAATKLLNGLVEANPKDTQALTNLAQVQARGGQLDAATETLKKVMAIKPTTEVRLALAQLSAARGREEETVKLLEDARAADAKAAAPRLLLARAYYARNNFEFARKAADELTAIEPNKPEPYLLSAAIALRQNDKARATKDVTEAVRVAPNSAAAWLGKGEIHEQAGEFDEARTAYRRAQALAPESPFPSAAIARVDVAMGDSSAALAQAREMQKTPSQKVAGMRLEGDLLTRLGRLQEALALFEQIHSMEPSQLSVMALYEARVRAQKPAPEQVLVDWLKKHPNDVAIRGAVAEFQTRNGRRDRAIAEYESGLKVQPNNAVLLNNLAWLYFEVGDSRAMATAQRARQFAPNNPAIADTLGWILFNQNQQQEGLKLLREAAAGAPGYADIQYHFATALSRSGNAAEAKSVAEKFLATNPSQEWRAKFEAYIRPK